MILEVVTQLFWGYSKTYMNKPYNTPVMIRFDLGVDVPKHPVIPKDPCE